MSEPQLHSEHLVYNVGISQMAVSDRPEAILRTCSLGSCAGIVMYSRKERVGGLLHAQLPLSGINRERAGRNPCVFVDTGTDALLLALVELGVRRSHLVVKIAGCARRHLGSPIGDCNYEALRAALERCGLRIAAADVGGTVPRTLSLAIADGTVEVESDGRRYEL